MRNIRHNYWIKSGFFTIAQRLSVPLFGVGSFLILIRSLSEEQMGVWALFLNVVTTLEVARNGLIKGAIVKYMNSSKEEDKEAIKSTSFIINAIYTTISTLLLLVGANWIASGLNTPQLSSMFYIYGISAMLMLPFSHFEYIQQANMSFKGIFYSYFTKQGIFFILIAGLILLFKFDLSPHQLVLIQTIGIFGGSIISFAFSKKFLSQKLTLSKEWLSRQWKFGRFGFFTNVSNSGLTTTDHLLIGGMVSTASVGVYNASARITNIFIIPSVAIADILYPKSVEAQAKSGKKEVQTLYEKAVGATLVPLVPVVIFMWFFPDVVIRILAGEKYLDAVPILQVAITGILILPFLKQFGTIMNTVEKPHYNFYFVLSLSLINLISNFLFISTFGVIGGAYGTLLSYFIGFIASQIILNRMIDSSISGVLKFTGFFYKKAFQLATTKLSR